MKSASSLPIVLDMSHLGITSMTSFHTLRCERGFMYLTQKVSNISLYQNGSCFTPRVLIYIRTIYMFAVYPRK